MSYMNFECTRATFRPRSISHIRWPSQTQDYLIVSEFWRANIPLSQSDWADAHAQGYRFCAYIENDQILSLAAEWRYSEGRWEVAGVRTHPDHQRLGYAKVLVAFVTAHILSQDRVATCTIEVTNIGMIRTAQSVGFQVITPAS